MFSWKPIYIELGERLLAYRDKQAELLGWLRQLKADGVPVVGLTDQNPKGTANELTEIDPFTRSRSARGCACGTTSSRPTTWGRSPRSGSATSSARAACGWCASTPRSSAWPSGAGRGRSRRAMHLPTDSRCWSPPRRRWANSTAVLDSGQAPVTMERFRPNLVLDGLDGPHAEDSIDLLEIEAPEGPVRLRLVKPCTRCTIPDVDPATGATGHAVADALRTYRADPRMNGGLTFGMNAVFVDGIGHTLQAGAAARATIRW